MKLKFSCQVSKIQKIPNFMEICPVGTDLLSGERRTDMTEVTVFFAIFRTPLTIPTTLQLFIFCVAAIR